MASSNVPEGHAEPLGSPTALVAATDEQTGRVVAVWTDVENAAGRAPSLGLAVNVHSRPLGTDVRIAHPLPAGS